MKSVQDFRENIQLNSTLIIKGQEHTIQQIIKFRFDNGDFYFKLYLIDGNVLADDLERNCFIFVKEVFDDLEIVEKTLVYDNKTFKWLYSAKTTAEEVWGSGRWKVGNQETFSDYESNGNYLSLGVNSQTGKREDYYGKILQPKDIKIKEPK